MQVTDLIQNDVIAMHHSFEELTFFTGEILNGSASQNGGSSNQIDAGKVIQNLSKWLIKPLKFDQSSFGITSGDVKKRINVIFF